VNQANRRVVFIMGTGHCGSTLVELILGSHTSAFGLGEFWSTGFDPDQSFCSICDGECEFWDLRAKSWLLHWYLHKPRSRLGTNIRRLVQRHRSVYSYLCDWFDASILIDSSKSVNLIKPQLRFSYQWRNIQPVLLYVVRDGRAVTNSYFRKYPERGYQSIVDDWVDRVTSMDQFYSEFEQTKRIVHYEDMASQPENTTKALCNFLAIDYQPAMVRYWQHDHHVVGGNAGTRSMIFKHREKYLNDQQKHRIVAGEWHGGYYEHEPAIKLDLRWQRELSRANQILFDQIGGELNEHHAYEGS
jgi:hypothetical protein